MLYKSKTLLVATEATEDTAESAAGSNAVKSMNASIVPYDGDRNELDFDELDSAATDVLMSNAHCTMSFGVPLNGSGTAGTAPAFGPILEACGFSETIDAGTSVTYDLIWDETTIESATTHFLRTAYMHEVTGCRGAASITLARGGRPDLMISDWKGSYKRPEAAAAVTPDYSGYNQALSVSKANTATFTLDSFAACVESFELNFGHTVTRTDAPNCRKTRLGRPKPTASLTIKAPTLAEKDFWGKMESHEGVISKVALNIVHGTTAGQIVTLADSAVQIRDIKETEIDDELGYVFDLGLGDPNIVFT